MKLKTISVLCLLSFVCSVCHGTDWYVSQAGAGLKNGTSADNAWSRFGGTVVVWSSIQPGDTLYIIGTIDSGFSAGKDGTTDNYITIAGYDESSTINSGFNFIGYDWVKLTNLTVNGIISVHDAYSEYIWIDHVDVNQGGTGTAIKLYDCSNVRVSYCTITNGENGIWSGAWLNGPDDYITIDHCIITDIEGDLDSHCIGMEGGQYWTIEYNELSYANTGITLYGNYINNNTIRYNNVHHMEATRSTGTGGQRRGYGIGFEGNVAEGYTRTGNYVYNNIIYDCNGVDDTTVPASGIRAKFYDNTNYIYNNTVYNCSPNYEITAMQINSVWQPMGGVFKNNISLSPNDSCGSVYKKQISMQSNAAGYSGLDFSNNCYFDGDSSGFTVGASTYNFAQWQSFLSTNSVITSDTDSMYTNPLLTNPDANDLSPQTGSPCINAGKWVGLSTDYNGNNVIHAPDIGAYEFPEQLKRWARIRRN